VAPSPSLSSSSAGPADLREASDIARRLWQSFFGNDLNYYDDGYQAPEPVRRLGTAIAQLRDRLLDFHSLFRQLGGLDYPRVSSIAAVLANCEVYLAHNSALHPFHDVTTDPDHHVWRQRRVWQKQRFRFDEKARKLADGIVLELQRLVLFCGRIAL